MGEIQQTQYQDPEDRRKNLDLLKGDLEMYYNDRVKRIFDLLGKDCKH
jgi:hypothetical protein